MNNDDDFIMLYNFLKDVNYTGNRDGPSNRKKFFTTDLPKKVSEIQTKDSMKIQTTLMI